MKKNACPLDKHVRGKEKKRKGKERENIKSLLLIQNKWEKGESPLASPDAPGRGMGKLHSPAHPEGRKCGQRQSISTSSFCPGEGGNPYNFYPLNNRKGTSISSGKWGGKKKEEDTYLETIIQLNKRQGAAKTTYPSLTGGRLTFLRRKREKSSFLRRVHCRFSQKE